MWHCRKQVQTLVMKLHPVSVFGGWKLAPSNTVFMPHVMKVWNQKYKYVSIWNNNTTDSYTILFLVKIVTISFCLQSCNAEEFS